MSHNEITSYEMKWCDMVWYSRYGFMYVTAVTMCVYQWRKSNQCTVGNVVSDNIDVMWHTLEQHTVAYSTVLFSTVPSCKTNSYSNVFDLDLNHINYVSEIFHGR